MLTGIRYINNTMGYNIKMIGCYKNNANILIKNVHEVYSKRLRTISSFKAWVVVE